MIYGDGKPEGPYLRIVITNVGTQPTIVSGVGIAAFPKAFAATNSEDGKYAVLTGGGYSTRLPKSIGAGEYITSYAVQDDDTISKWMQMPSFYIQVFHSWSDRPKNKRFRPAI